MTDEQRKTNLDFLMTVAGMMKIAIEDGGILGIDRYWKGDKSTIDVHMKAKAWHEYFDTPDEVVEDRGDGYMQLTAYYRGLRFFCLEDIVCA